MAIDKERVIEKMKELNMMLRDAGLMAEVAVRVSDQNGYPEMNLLVDGGRWNNSTAVCNPDSFAVDEEYHDERDHDTWFSSADNC